MAVPFELLSEKIADEALFWTGLTHFVKDLHRFINLIPNDAPILLSGDWGSGKSSAINALQKRLEGKQREFVQTINMSVSNATIKKEKVRRKVIIFEAWRYEQESSLLSCLIRDIWEKGELAQSWKTRKKHLLGTAIKATAAITVRSIPSILQFFPGGEILKTVLKGITSDKLKKELESIDIQQDPETNYTDQLHESFKGIVDSNYKNYQELVIIIDDLDRCSPESAIHLLESMRTLINNTLQGIKGNKTGKVKVRFIVAMDKVTLSEAVENKFSELCSYDANRYLEKLFPYMFNLPRIMVNEVEGFILNLVTHNGATNTQKEKNKSTELALYQEQEDKKEIGHLTQDCINLLINNLNFGEFQNPRLIKRCINKYALCKMADEKRQTNDATYSDEDSLATRNKSLITWIAATEKWPLLKRLIFIKPLPFWESLKNAILKNTSIEDLEGQRFMRQSGFKEFYKAHFFNDVSQIVSEFRLCEKTLNDYGL